MRVKKVNRYYCEFCKKANCSGPSIKKHETHCTGNPNRECRVHKTLLGECQPELSRLIGLLPVAANFPNDGQIVNGDFVIDSTLALAVAEALPKLREEANNCPACILAALRQAKIPRWHTDGFDFSAEMKPILADYNAEQEHERGGY